MATPSRLGRLTSDSPPAESSTRSFSGLSDLVISIVIPVKNGRDRLPTCLRAIKEQATAEPVEILVIDSGSTDGTPELARAFGAAVHEIPPHEFNHAGTRNLGASLASGEIVVFTVDDAIPVGSAWLESLVAPLRRNERLAGTYSRQIAHTDAPPNQAIYIDYRYGPRERTQRAESPGDLDAATILFSNVSSAIRRSVLERIPLAEDVLIAEDLEWCKRVLLAGFEVAYVPGSVVRHSHRYSLPALFRRYFDQGVVAHETFLNAGARSSKRTRGEGLAMVRFEIRRLWESRQRRWIPYALVYDAVRFAGFQLGVKHRVLPRALLRRWSRLPIYWESR